MKHLKYFTDIILEKSIGSEPIRIKYYSNIDKKLFYKIINLDPTSIRKKEFSKPGKYSKWLLLQLEKGNITEELLNDDSFSNKLNYYLFIFSTGWYKSKIIKSYGETFIDEESFYRDKDDSNFLPNMKDEKYTKSSSIYYDITKFKTISDFIKFLDSYVKLYESETEKSKFDVIFSDNNLDILVPLNFSASYATAKNTQWCTQSLSAFSLWNSKFILFRIIPKSKEFDRVKLTWGKSKWFMATTKYPEIQFDFDYNKNKWKPFDKWEDGKETWENLVEDNEEKYPDDKNIKHWKKLRDTISLLSDKGKQTIFKYWEGKIINKNEIY